MEDFVPYETVLKLEKKGYKGKTIRYHGYIYDVLKWLREEKKIHIAIDLWLSGYAAMIYTGISEENNNFNWKDFYDDNNKYETYELAALAGVEYCLDNLI